MFFIVVSALAGSTRLAVTTHKLTSADAACTVFELLMMSGKPARNM
jgi:hypothetical protein